MPPETAMLLDDKDAATASIVTGNRYKPEKGFANNLGFGQNTYTDVQ